MKQVSRKLIGMRNNSFVVPKVTHRPHPDSKYQQCHTNARLEAERSDTYWTSGWMVGDYDKKSDSTHVFFHFWNIDKQGNHYDTTPFRNGGTHLTRYEYVCDDDMVDECLKYSDNIQSEYIILPPCLLFTSKHWCMDIADNPHKNIHADEPFWVQLKSTEQLEMATLLEAREQAQQELLKS